MSAEPKRCEELVQDSKCWRSWSSSIAGLRMEQREKHLRKLEADSLKNENESHSSSGNPNTMKAAFYRSSTCDPWWWPKETCGPGTQSLNKVSGRRPEVESTMDIPGEQDVQFKIFTHLIIPVYFLSLQVLLFRFFPWTDCYISALVIKTLVLVFSGCDPHWPSAQNQGLIHTFARSFLLSPLPEVKWSEVKSLSRVRLFATSWTVAYNTPLSMGLSRQEWVAISFSRGSSQPRDRTWVSRIVGRCFTIWATRIVPHCLTTF